LVDAIFFIQLVIEGTPKSEKKMKDEVLEYIKNNLQDCSFSAQDIAMKFCIKINVASHYLNQLFSDGKLLMKLGVF